MTENYNLLSRKDKNTVDMIKTICNFIVEISIELLSRKEK